MMIDLSIFERDQIADAHMADANVMKAIKMFSVSWSTVSKEGTALAKENSERKGLNFQKGSQEYTF